MTVKQRHCNVLHLRVLSMGSLSDVMNVIGGNYEMSSSSIDFHIFRPPVWHRGLKGHRGVMSSFERHHLFGMSHAD